MNSDRSFRPWKSFRMASRSAAQIAALVAALGAASLIAPLAAGAAPQAQNQQTAAASDIALSARAQIAALLSEKASRTAVERKLDSRLVYELKQTRGLTIAGVPRLATNIVYEADSRVIVDVRAARISDQLQQQLKDIGVDILYSNATAGKIRMQATLDQVESVAALPQVMFVQPKQEAMTSRFGSRTLERAAPGHDQAGAAQDPLVHARAAIAARVRNALGGQQAVTNASPVVDSEGDTTHRAILARSKYGVDGAGMKIGVLSDGVTSLAAVQALGALGPVTVLPGQAGMGDEGTAMLQIVHDLAPGAQLYFATANPTIENFAANILALRAAGCNIIVDDVYYFVETPFQDGQAPSILSTTNGGVVIQAVKDVTADGALYFSSAGNSGNLDDLTSGTWEGDYADGGALPAPISVIEGGQGQLHSFGSQTYDTLTRVGQDINLTWSDPLGGSANDYDLFLLDSSGTTVLAASTDLQDGTQDPYEDLGPGSVGDRIVIVQYLGAGRFLHLDTNRGHLSIATSGETHGHAATSAPNSFGVAAAPAYLNYFGGPNGPYPNPFNSTDVVEPYSSDGPRRIFYGSDGTPITPGNVGSTGGLVLNKPDFTAADCVSTNVTTSVTGSADENFSPFCGTSAAAPHAAAIAALVMSANLSATPAQIRTALLDSAIDIMAAGIDRDSGVGIIMADTAVAPPLPPATTLLSPSGKISTNGPTFTWNTVSSATMYYLSLQNSSGTAILQQSYTSAVCGVSTCSVTPAALSGGAYTWSVETSNSSGQGPQSSSLAFFVETSAPGDYDGDGKADLTVFRPSTGHWYTLDSNASYTTSSGVSWGASTDTPVPGDYDGDGKADPAVYRPSTGQWFILTSSSHYTANIVVSWGVSTDIPVPGDYDGDGKTDPAVYRPSTGQWFILTSSSHYTANIVVSWGVSTDIPVPGDYDGDGRTDPAVFRPSTGQWLILESSTSYTTNIVVSWGVSTDIPVPGDYDGDGRIDPAVFRPSTGQWFFLNSSTTYTSSGMESWGTSTDVPVPGDYDGDGKNDPAVFRPSTGQWLVLKSSTNYTTNIVVSWGISTDIPIDK